MCIKRLKEGLTIALAIFFAAGFALGAQGPPAPKHVLLIVTPAQRGFDKFFGTLQGQGGYFNRRIGIRCDSWALFAPKFAVSQEVMP